MSLYEPCNQRMSPSDSIALAESTVFLTRKNVLFMREGRVTLAVSYVRADDMELLVVPICSPNACRLNPGKALPAGRSGRAFSLHKSTLR